MVLSPDVKGAFVLCDIQWRYFLYCQKLGLPVPKTLYFGTPAIDVAKVGRDGNR